MKEVNGPKKKQKHTTKQINTINKAERKTHSDRFFEEKCKEILAFIQNGEKNIRVFGKKNAKLSIFPEAETLASLEKVRW